MPEQIDSRQLNRYKITAERLKIPLELYLSNGASGKRYCSKCLKWKRRSSFLEYISTQTSFAGVCKPCRGVKRKPVKVEGRLWGPAIRAANKLKISVKEYLDKREEGMRWCTTHKEWFNANEILESPRYQGGSIIRCRPCQMLLKRKKL